MCQSKVKSLSVLLLFLLPLQQVSPLAISLTKLTTQNQSTNFQNYLMTDQTTVSTYMTSLNEDSMNLTDSNDNMTNLNPQQITASELLNNQDKLLDNLEEQFISLTNQVAALQTQSSALEKDNKELTTMLMSSKATIDDLKKNLENYKQALKSNQNDTANLIALFAEAQQEIDSIKTYVAKLEKDKRHLRNARITCISFAALGIGSIILGNTLPNEDARKILNAAGIGMVVSSGVTFGVSFVF